jgi:hypothetical protein
VQSRAIRDAPIPDEEVCPFTEATAQEQQRTAASAEPAGKKKKEETIAKSTLVFAIKPAESHRPYNT